MTASRDATEPLGVSQPVSAALRLTDYDGNQIERTNDVPHTFAALPRVGDTFEDVHGFIEGDLGNRLWRVSDVRWRPADPVEVRKGQSPDFVPLVVLCPVEEV